jgi:hypothetical protein
MTTGSNNIKSSVRHESPVEQKINSNNGKSHAGPRDPVFDVLIPQRADLRALCVSEQFNCRWAPLPSGGGEE